MLRSVLIAALVALNGPQPADYQVCSSIHNGPVQKQTPSAPYQRRDDDA